MSPENVILFSPSNVLGGAIKDARIRRRATLEFVAMQCFTTPSTISRIEAGKFKTLDLNMITQLSRVLRSPKILRLAVTHIQSSFPELPDEDVAL